MIVCIAHEYNLFYKHNVLNNSKIQAHHQKFSRFAANHNKRLFFSDGLTKGENQPAKVPDSEIKRVVDNAEREKYENAFFGDKGWTREFSIKTKEFLLLKTVNHDTTVKISYRPKDLQTTESIEKNVGEK
jgi:hypothetical protein